MSDREITNPHDLFTRQSLLHLPTARSFIERFLPADVVERLDLDTLEVRDGSFVDEALQENLTDLLFEVSFRDGDNVLVGVLFEHKSYVDRFIALQLLRYLVNIWERQRRDGEDLMVVIPIVLYHGRAVWNAATSMRGLIASPDEFARYVPDAETCLVDLSQIPDGQLGDSLRLQIVLRILKHIFDPHLADRLEEILPLVKAVTTEENSLQLLETLLRYIFAGADVSKHQDVEQVVRTSLATDSDIMPTIADALRAEGRQEGLDEGRQDGLRHAVRQVVEQRFPDADPQSLNGIDEITSFDSLTDILRLAGSCESIDDLCDFISNI